MCKSLNGVHLKMIEEFAVLERVLQISGFFAANQYQTSYPLLTVLMCCQLPRANVVGPLRFELRLSTVMSGVFYPFYMEIPTTL